MFSIFAKDPYAKAGSLLASTVMLMLFLTSLGLFAGVTAVSWVVSNAATLLAFAAGLWVMGRTQSIGLTLAIMAVVWITLIFLL